MGRSTSPSWSKQQIMEIDISEITVLTKDRATSIRLYRDYRKAYKHQTPQWVVEKIIHDLERDRRTTSRKPVIRTRPTKPTINIQLWRQQRSQRSNPRRPIYRHQQKPLKKWMIAALILGPITVGWFVNEHLGYVGQVSERNLLNFPPPSLYQQIPAGSVVTMHNRVPEPMTVRLMGIQNHEFRIEACTTCSRTITQADGARLCKGSGPSLSVTLPPGTYDAQIRFAGQTRGFKSQWQITPKWEHYQCIFTNSDLL